MAFPSNPYTPYAEYHRLLNGPGDSRPTALQVVEDCKAIGKLKEKTILITGCSSGIGVETARALYETGATIFMAARDMPKLEGVIDDIVQNAEYNKDGVRPQGIELHLESFDLVRKGAEEFVQKSNGKLNVLINNAGVMSCPYGTTEDRLETQIGVNHFAHFLLFQLLKDCLLDSAKESGSTSRVVNVSSAGHRFSRLKFSNKTELDAWNNGDGYEKWAGYGSSKTANIYMATSIARHYGSQNLLGWSVHPGGVVTDLPRHLDQTDYEAFPNFEEMMRTSFKSVEQGAATTVWAAVSSHFEGGNGGRYLADVGETHPIPGDQVRSEVLSDEAAYSEWAYDEELEEKL